MAYAHRGETADQRIAERPMDAGQGQAWVIVDRARLGNSYRNMVTEQLKVCLMCRYPNGTQGDTPHELRLRSGVGGCCLLNRQYLG
jgi:hypothetical protein